MFVAGDIAQAQIVNNPHSGILEEFESLQVDMRSRFRDLGATLFWGLITIEFVVSASIFAFRGGDIAGFGAMLLPRLFIIGIFVFLFRNGSAVADLIVASFTTAGTGAAGVGLSPDAIFEHGLALGRELIDQGGFFDQIIVGVLAIITTVMFALIAANVMIAIAEVYVVLTAGVLLLGFLGSSWTRDYAMGYFRFAIASGVKLLSMQVIIGIGFAAIQRFFPVGSESIEFDSVLAMIGTLFLIFLLSAQLPATAAAMVGGFASGGIGFLAQGQAQLTSINANTRNVANSLSKIANSGSSAAYNAGSSVKSAGIIGGGVGGAAATLGKAVGGDLKTSAASIAKGNGGQVGSIGSRVADNLRSQR